MHTTIHVTTVATYYRAADGSLVEPMSAILDGAPATFHEVVLAARSVSGDSPEAAEAAVSAYLNGDHTAEMAASLAAAGIDPETRDAQGRVLYIVGTFTRREAATNFMRRN